jgi:hypothetical protein
VPSAPQEAPTPDGDEVAEPLPQVEVELKSPAPATTIPGAVRRPQKGKNITVRVKDRGPDPDKEAARVADKKARDRTLSTVPPRASGPSTPNTVPPTSLPQIAAPTRPNQQPHRRLRRYCHRAMRKFLPMRRWATGNSMSQVGHMH